MNLISENEIKNEIEEVTKSSKPNKYKMQVNYPYNSLEDKGFELLLYSLVNAKKPNIKGISYNKCGLMAGTGDKGRDIVLLKDNNIVTVIQCKKYVNNLEKPDIAKEVIKFVLHSIQDKVDNIDYSQFTYIFAVSTGINTESNNLIMQFNSNITKEKDFEKWTNDVIDSYKRLKISYEEVSDKLTEILTKIKVDKLLPIEITEMINEESQIITTFFDVDKVISLKDFEDIVYGKNLNISDFLDTYKKSVLNISPGLTFLAFQLIESPRRNIFILYLLIQHLF